MKHRVAGRFFILAAASIAFMSAGAAAFTTESFYSDAIILATDEIRSGPIDRPIEVAPTIAGCWVPPHEGDEVTFRTSFRRDGSVFGLPSITFMRPAAEEDGAALAASIQKAVAACSPLPFTSRLGDAIAGKVFLIRLVADRKDRASEPGGAGRMRPGS